MCKYLRIYMYMYVCMHVDGLWLRAWALLKWNNSNCDVHGFPIIIIVVVVYFSVGIVIVLLVLVVVDAVVIGSNELDIQIMKFIFLNAHIIILVCMYVCMYCLSYY